MIIDAVCIPGHTKSPAIIEWAAPLDGERKGRMMRLYMRQSLVQIWEPLKDNSSDGWRPRLWPYQSRMRTPG